MPGFGTAGRTPPPHVGAAGGASSLATRRPSTARAGAADERHVSRPYAGPGDRPPRLSNRRGWSGARQQHWARRTYGWLHHHVSIPLQILSPSLPVGWRCRAGRAWGLPRPPGL